MSRLLLLLGLVTPLFVQAQLSPSYLFEANAPIQWQHITTTGTFLVQTEAGLQAVDPSTGTPLWNNDALRLPTSDQVREIPGSSLLMIQEEAATAIVDPFTGTVVYNTAEASIAELNYEKVLYASNTLLVAGKDQAGEARLQMIDLNTGSQLWEMSDNVGKVIHTDAFSSEECLIVTLFTVYRVNTQTGEVIWENSTSASADAMGDAGALGALMQGLAEEMSDGVNFDLTYFESPDGEQFILGSTVENKIQSMSSDEATINYTNNYTLFNKADGERVWREPVELEGKVGTLIFEDQQIIVLPDDGGKTVINAYDRNTGEAQWGKKGRGIKLKGGVYDYVPVEGGYLLISGSSDKSFLQYLVPSGELPFDKPIKIGGQVVKTFSSPKGIAFATTQEFDILDPAEGELLMKKSIATKATLVEPLADEKAVLVFDLKDEILRKIDLNSATEVAFTEEEIQFDGREDAERLTIDADGYLLTSSQNIGRYSTDGTVQFANYFKAPGESGLRKALLLAQAARAAYISASSYYAAGTLNNAVDEVSQEDAVAGAVVQGFGQVYQELGDQASAFAKQSFEQATARFKATQEGRNFRIVLANMDKSNALLQVSHSTGKVMNEINLGKEKEAQYAVDDVIGMVFVRQGDNRIAAYNLNKN